MGRMALNRTTAAESDRSMVFLGATKLRFGVGVRIVKVIDELLSDQVTERQAPCATMVIGASALGSGPVACKAG